MRYAIQWILILLFVGIAFSETQAPVIGVSVCGPYLVAQEPDTKPNRAISTAIERVESAGCKQVVVEAVTGYRVVYGTKIVQD